MKKILVLSFLTMASLSGLAQHDASRNPKIDTIQSMLNRFNRNNIRIASDTIVSFRDNNGEKKKISENVLSISEDKMGSKKAYKIQTQNIPVGNDNITTVTAMIDFDDLHLLKLQLTAKADSGYVEFENHHFKGWSQLPKELMQYIDFEFNGHPLLNDGNTPWLMGLLRLRKNKIVVLPAFFLFTNQVKYTEYSVLGTEKILLAHKRYVCWKVEAGPAGPPGYVSHHWYVKKTGRLLKIELSKNGEAVKYVSELKTLRNN